MLHTEPSLSIYSEFQEQDLEREKLGITDGCLETPVTTGDSMDREFSFGNNKSMGFIKEGEREDDGQEEEESLDRIKKLCIEEYNEIEPASPPMYLTTGFGFDANGVGNVGGIEAALKSDESDGGDVEEHYKRLVTEDPSNPLFFMNYAQLLQSKGNLPGAEEYYFRATLADPKDGQILSQYAKLVWELHHDQDRALNYFESAARAAPEDSHILAAYASFLSEIDEHENKDFVNDDHVQVEKDEGWGERQNSIFEEQSRPVSPPLHLAAGLGIDMAGFGAGTGGVDYTEAGPGEGANVGEYYKRMVEENPGNPLFLRNYAQFLQSKGNHQGAEEYYSCAILIDPGDDETLSLYAVLMWELHQDRDKALSYFERAVQATPADSLVLAAYARFLWETEDDEEDNSGLLDDIRIPGFQRTANA